VVSVFHLETRFDEFGGEPSVEDFLLGKNLRES
jgi:hypothetical protein